jgi:glycosyltransferase involved in cell wall biosynthesis
LLVSVITPSYNQAAYLETTIRSVINQDFQPIEYLVVDGGSTDGSVEIIRQYANHISWWTSEPDRGQADAINKGFKNSHGELIAWLNSDDIYLPGAVQKALEVFQKQPELGMAFGNAVTIDPEGNHLNDLQFGDWGLAELLRFRIICQPAVFMRRSVLEQAGYLDPNYHYMLDHHLWLRMARLAPIQHIDQSLAAARHHPTAKNVSQAPGFGLETLRLLEDLKHDPDFAQLVAQDRRRIEGGAYRLNARYLLDGNQPGAALRSYGKALVCYPSYGIRHWHRILYACFSLVGMKKLADAIKSKRQPKQALLPGYKDITG